MLRNLTLILVASTAVGACTLAPKYERPVLPVARCRSFGKIDGDLSGRDERRRGQHDDEQHQHDIDQRNHVDLIDLTLHGAPCTARAVR